MEKQKHLKKNSNKEENKTNEEVSELILKEIMKKKLIDNIDRLKSRGKIENLKRNLSRKYKLSKMPTNIVLLNYVNNLRISNDKKNKLRELLLTKPSRSISGVTPVAIMGYPFPCPHGKCAYCPGGPESYFGETPQSYTGKEPASRRALRAHYDSYLQVFNRLEQYLVMGHSPEKVELIIMGGTFPSFKINYQDFFIEYAFKAMNDFSRLFYKKDKRNKDEKKIFNYKKFIEFFELPAVFKDERTKRIQTKLLNLKYKGKTNLKREQIKNEKSRIRDVALCIETRPDYSMEKDINQMLKLGTTRVELGVQSLKDTVLKRVNRGHSVGDVIKATQLLRDSFLKIGYHIMPGMPGVSMEDDVNTFKELFSNPDFKPDALKIYPLMVFKGTKVYEWWKKGKYRPLTTKEASEIIVKSMKYIPEYCRIMRIQRDIPTKYSEAGVDITNFRQYVQKKMEKLKIKSRDIRAREPRGRRIDFNSIRLIRRNYEANNGQEIFLSYEDTKNDILIGFVRLRIPYKPFRKEITEKTAGIRELHVYGRAIPIDEKITKNSNKGIDKYEKLQHRGFGRKLMEEAERIALEEFDKNKMLVISGIGVKEYYKKLGYKKEGVYMGKRLK